MTSDHPVDSPLLSDGGMTRVDVGPFTAVATGDPLVGTVAGPTAITLLVTGPASLGRTSNGRRSVVRSSDRVDDRSSLVGRVRRSVESAGRASVC